MDSQSFHQGNTLGDINTTPHQEHQKMCTRNSPCYQQGCSLSYTPTSLVLNLDKDLDSSNASSNPPTSLLPQPLDNHPIMLDVSKRNPNQQCAWTGSFHTPVHKFHEIQPGIPERLLQFNQGLPPPCSNQSSIRQYWRTLTSMIEDSELNPSQSSLRNNKKLNPSSTREGFISIPGSILEKMAQANIWEWLWIAAKIVIF